MKYTILYFCSAILLSLSPGHAMSGVGPIPRHDSLTLFSSLLNENRVINVWTPQKYHGSNIRYPVLYMPDGGVKEDFPHIANTLAKLVEEKRIPPFILVGIENTDRRRDLTGYSEAESDKQCCPTTDGAKNFRAFIVEELAPTIDQKYRTTNYKGIIGESLAGLFVMETFLTHPQTFQFYIAMDPSLWWNDQYLVRHADSLLSEFPDQDLKLWFAASKAEDISQWAQMLSETLQNHAPDHLFWKYSDEPDEAHHTIFRGTKEKALIWSLNGPD